MLLNAVKAVALIILTGVPLYLIFIRKALSGERIPEFSTSRISYLLYTSIGIYTLSALLSGLASTELEGSGYLLDLSNLVLAVFLILFIHRVKNKPSPLYYGLIAGSAIIMLLFHSFESHVAGLAGWLPVAGYFAHIITAALWIGGVITIMVNIFCPVGGNAPSTDVYRQFHRFAGLTCLLLVLILVSGAILFTSNIHSLTAFENTPYGQVLEMKFILVFLLIALMPYALLKSRAHDTAERQNGTTVFPGRWILVINTMILAAITVLSGSTRQLTPPDTAPFLNPQTWQVTAGQYSLRIDVQPVAGNPGTVRFEVYLPEDLMQSPGTVVTYSLSMVDNPIGVNNAEAVQVSQNSFQGEAVFPLPGQWTFDLEISGTGGITRAGTFEFDIPAQPLVEDIRTYLSLNAITYNRANMLTFIVGVLLVAVYGWLTWRTYKGYTGHWVGISGILGLVVGVYLVVSVTLVRTYPSTYWSNVRDYTPESIDQGRAAYTSHCAECHGTNGRGDGPWAVDNRGRIPDISSPHMDVHTDGEIFWWISYGIPSLEMPPLEDETTEVQRWDIINYVRSMRHGVPPG